MMMKLKSLLAGVAFAVVSVTASATPWTQTIDFPDRYVGNLGSTSWTHNLAPAGFTAGFDVINNFSLSVNMYDDGGFFDLFEWGRIDLAGTSADQTWEINSGWYTTGGSAVGALLSLSQTGILNVTVRSMLGDFYVAESRLTASGVDGQQVPEPGILALLGLGFAGLAYTRRRRFQ